MEASAVEQCRCISPEKRSSKNTSESLHSFPAKEGHRRAGKGGALKLQQLIHVHEKSCKTLVAADFSAGWHPSKCRWWLHEDGRQHLVEASAVEQCRCISPEKKVFQKHFRKPPLLPPIKGRSGFEATLELEPPQQDHRCCESQNKQRQLRKGKKVEAVITRCLATSGICVKAVMAVTSWRYASRVAAC